MTQKDTSENSPIVFALVVTYNRSAHLIECLDALCKQTAPISKIVVIDNASTDGTEGLMGEKTATNGNIEYVRLPTNTGGSGGFHQGMAYLADRDFDFIWIMDDDVAAEEDCLEALLRHHREYDVIQPVRKYYDDTFVVSEPRSINLSNPFLPLKREIISAGEALDEVTEIAAVPFEGPLFSKKAIRATGLPEYDYFIIADDTEYSIRLLKHGFRIGLVPNAVLRRQIPPAQGERNLSWKFSHHLRNHFHIDRTHGTFLVRHLRPFLLATYYVATSIVRRRDINSFKMIANSWKKK